jgi:hypothetical protein
MQPQNAEARLRLELEISCVVASSKTKHLAWGPSSFTGLHKLLSEHCNGLLASIKPPVDYGLLGLCVRHMLESDLVPLNHVWLLKRQYLASARSGEQNYPESIRGRRKKLCTVLHRHWSSELLHLRS